MQRTLSSIDGNTQRLDGGAMFGNVPRPLWERWAPPDERNRIELACRALLIEEPDRRILVETGIGAFFDPQLKDRYGVQGERHVLLDNLAERGLTHQDIDVVVLSHLHFDHAGGLLSAWRPNAAPELLFPQARYVIGQDSWKRAESPHLRDRASFIPELLVLLQASGRVELVTGSTSSVLGPDYRFHRSDGHTPGQILLEVPGQLGPVVFAGDLVPGRAWVHKSVTMGYDRYPELLIEEKIALLDDLVARNGRLFFTHDPTCALARVTRDEHGRYGSLGCTAHIHGEPA